MDFDYVTKSQYIKQMMHITKLKELNRRITRRCLIRVYSQTIHNSSSLFGGRENCVIGYRCVTAVNSNKEDYRSSFLAFFYEKKY